MLKRWFQTVFKNPHTAELLRGGVYAAFFKGVSFLSGFFIAWLIARFYGLEALGIYTLVWSLWSVGAFAGRFSLDIVINRMVTALHLADEHERLRLLVKQAMRLSFFIAAGISVVLYLFADSIALYLFKKPEMVSLVQVGVWFIIPMCLGMLLQSGLRAMGKVRSYTFSSFASTNIIILLLLIPSVFISTDYRWPVAVAGVAVLLGALVSQLLWTKQVVPAKHAGISRSEQRVLLKMAWPIFLSSLFAMGNQYLPQLLLGYFTDVSQVGLLEGANRLARFVAVGFFMLNTLAASKFVELLAQPDRKELQQLLNQKALIISSVGLLCFLPLVLFPQFFLGLLGKEFEPAAPALTLMSSGQLVSAFCGSVGILMVMAGLERQLLWVNVTGALLTGCCAWLLIPGWGIEGAASARVVGMVWVNVGCCVVLLRKKGLRTFYWPW